MNNQYKQPHIQRHTKNRSIRSLRNNVYMTPSRVVIRLRPAGISHSIMASSDHDALFRCSLNIVPGLLFNEHLNKASWSLDTIIEWEIPAGLNLITTLLGVIYTFFRKDLMLLFFVCLCICGCLYWLFIRSLRNTYNKI